MKYDFPKKAFTNGLSTCFINNFLTLGHGGRNTLSTAFHNVKRDPLKSGSLDEEI
jgi:hypothetical protein